MTVRNTPSESSPSRGCVAITICLIYQLLVSFRAEREILDPSHSLGMTALRHSLPREEGTIEDINKGALLIFALRRFDKGDKYVGGGIVTGARRKTSSIERRGALVPGIRRGSGHLQQRSPYDGSASCLEVAGPLRCDSNRG